LRIIGNDLGHNRLLGKLWWWRGRANFRKYILFQQPCHDFLYLFDNEVVKTEKRGMKNEILRFFGLKSTIFERTAKMERIGWEL